MIESVICSPPSPALCVATTILVKMHGARYMWITCVPLSWLVVVCYTAAWQKIFSSLPRVGFLAQAGALEQQIAAGTVPAAQLSAVQAQIFNNQLDAVVCGVFLVLVTAILLDSVRLWYGILTGSVEAKVTESPFVLSRLNAEEL